MKAATWTRVILNFLLFGLWAYTMAVAVALVTGWDMGWVDSMPVVYETRCLLGYVSNAIGA